MHISKSNTGSSSDRILPERLGMKLDNYLLGLVALCLLVCVLRAIYLEPHHKLHYG
jgi:hypothetical protein